ncbi:ribokinase [Oceaniglobus trochenteri]|uniref:ribokinase n=1 Tax=Oceaniglobus trochenteri TaxID=2763260 RepID=UPI001CFFD561|nr:ribokinase [Oceaniglobus trochenteri]
MPLHNLGSINIDLVYRVPHITAPGETLVSRGLERGLGGKGANTSIALAQSGAAVLHYGAIGPDGGWTLDELGDRGVDCTHVQRLDTPTGQAVIQVSDDGENAITLLKGANWEFSAEIAETIIANAAPGDWLVIQNETAHVPEVAARAKAAGLSVAYAAAPFDAEATRAVLPHITLLALNEIEAGQLEQALGQSLDSLDLEMVLVTRGAEGASLKPRAGEAILQPAARAERVVDTTAAGDTFLGFFLGRLSLGDPLDEALGMASAASAITVARPGAGGSIPSLDEVRAALP